MSVILRSLIASRTALPIPIFTRLLHQDQGPKNPSQDTVNAIDGLSTGSAKGRTGGGKPLAASSRNAPPRPKITNQSVPGWDASDSLTAEQRREVDEHNRDFDKKHDHGRTAPGDRVDEKFWGQQHRE